MPIRNTQNDLTDADWDRIERDIENLVYNYSFTAAELYYHTLLENIRTNKFGFPLASTTLMKRLKKGSESGVPLVDSGEYIQGIVLEGNQVKVVDGVHRGSGLSFLELSHILENGRLDKRIPPFPVWAKTMEELKPKFEADIRSLVEQLLNR